jgi:ribosomal protein S15P/S13E
MVATVFAGHINDVGLRVRRETAKVVWRRAYELAESTELADRFAFATELNRTARHDATTIAHAFALARTHVREHGGDAHARRALQLLQETIRLLVSASATNAKHARVRG